MTYFDVRAWIMFMQGQKCLLSDVITSGNRELLFLSHSKQKIYEEDNKSALERLGRHGTFKSRPLWSVRDGKGITRFRPWSPIATGNRLDRAEQIPKLRRRLAQMTFLIRFQSFRDPLRGELPQGQIFMNAGPNPLT